MLTPWTLLSGALYQTKWWFENGPPIAQFNHGRPRRQVSKIVTQTCQFVRVQARVRRGNRPYCYHTITWKSLITRFMGPTWGPPGARRTPCGPREPSYLGYAIKCNLLSLFLLAWKEWLYAPYVFVNFCILHMDLSTTQFVGGHVTGQHCQRPSQIVPTQILHEQLIPIVKWRAIVRALSGSIAVYCCWNKPVSFYDIWVLQKHGQNVAEIEWTCLL